VLVMDEEEYQSRLEGILAETRTKGRRLHALSLGEHIKEELLDKNGLPMKIKILTLCIGDVFTCSAFPDPKQEYVFAALKGNKYHCTSLKDGLRSHFKMAVGSGPHKLKTPSGSVLVEPSDITVLGQEGIEDFAPRWQGTKKIIENAPFLGVTLKELDKDELLTIIGFLSSELLSITTNSNIEFVNHLKTVIKTATDKRNRF